MGFRSPTQSPRWHWVCRVTPAQTWASSVWSERGALIGRLLSRLCHDYKVVAYLWFGSLLRAVLELLSCSLSGDLERLVPRPPGSRDRKRSCGSEVDQNARSSIRNGTLEQRWGCRGCRRVGKSCDGRSPGNLSVQGDTLQREFCFRERVYRVRYLGRTFCFEYGSASARSCFVASDPCHSGSIFPW